MTPIVAVVNAKGGVGKTTTSVGLAAEATHRGLRTLVIDVDTQENASVRLLGDQEGDDGRGFFRTVVDGDALEPVETSTSGLWVCPAGERTQDLTEALVRSVRDADPDEMLEAYAAVSGTIRESVSDFDFVVIDCPPSDQSRTLIDFVFAMSTHLLLPTKIDDDSTAAVTRALTRLVKLARRGVPVADPIGILVNDSDAFGTNLRAYARSEFDHFSDIVEPFDSFIEHRSGPCAYARRAKLTPRQFLLAAEAAERDGLIVDGESHRSPWSVGPARNFVNDFERVFDELWSRLVASGAAA